MRLHQLTWIYVGALVVIVISADRGWFSPLFKFIDSVPFGDKAGHFLLIGFLAFLVNLSFGSAKIRVGRIQVFKGNLYVMIPVVLEEISQIAFPRRTFDLVDLAADALGVLVFGRLARVTMTLLASRSRSGRELEAE